MIKGLFTLKICILLIMLSIGGVSCQKDKPNFDKKDRDTRLIGVWSIVEQTDREILPGDKEITFNQDGTCSGFHYPGGNRLFYTEGNNHLFVFVYGKGAKLSSWTYDDYYLIEEGKLYLWMSKEDLDARRYDSAITYTKKANP